MTEQVNQYLQELQHKGYASGTVAYRRIYLNQFFSFLNDRDLNKNNILEYQVYLSKSNLKSLTVHGKLSALHCFLSWLYKKGYVLFDLSTAINFIKREIYLPRRILSETEVKYFLSLPNTKTRKGIRDKAILELLYSTGMRRLELTGLNLYDLNIDDRTIRVLGKGRKERTLPVGSVALYWLLKYIQEVRSRTTRETALFLDLVCNSRLSPLTVTNLVYEYAKQAEKDLSRCRTGKVTPHTFRHSCAVHLLRNGADIRYIQELLGHASPETTQIYTRVVITDLDRVFRQTHPRARR